MREGGKMKDGAFIDPTIAPNRGRLSYLFSAGTTETIRTFRRCGISTGKRFRQIEKGLIGRVQTSIHEKPCLFPYLQHSPRPLAEVKGNPYGFSLDLVHRSVRGHRVELIPITLSLSREGRGET